MDGLTAFGLFSVTAMLVCYALENRSPWYTLAFAVSCALGILVWICAGRLAVWVDRGGLGRGCDPALAGARVQPR